MARDVGRYHKLPWGGGWITVSKGGLVKLLDLWDKDKLLLEYDEGRREIRISRL